MKIHVDVVAVKAGVRGNSQRCPAALILTEHLNEPVRVGEDYALALESKRYFRLSTPLIQMIERYDMTGYFKPGVYDVFSFES